MSLESARYQNGEFSTPFQQYNSFNEQQLFRELDLINTRLETLMLKMDALKISAELNEPITSPSSRLYQRQPQIRIEPNKQPIIIQQESPPQVYVNSGIPRNPTVGFKNNESDQFVRTEQPNDSLLLARQNEQFILRNRIKNLENEMSLSKELLKGSDEDEKKKYNEDISNLSEQIAAIGTQLEQNNREADSLKLRKENNLLNVLNDFSYKVYFENNSTQISPSDFSKLQEIVNIAEKNPKVTVVLRGFASKAGNPRYNEKISFQRAASVKKWLLENGLNLKDIITMHHGVDKSVDASRARRVEITFRAQ